MGAGRKHYSEGINEPSSGGVGNPIELGKGRGGGQSALPLPIRAAIPETSKTPGHH